jgi:hypothetical protein
MNKLASVLALRESGLQRAFRPNTRFILISLTIAVVLTVVMAVSVQFNRNPDEHLHLAAARYYEQHFFPPVIGDPAVRDSYSKWGTSYLDYQWLEYFLAGKFVLAFTGLFGSELLAARFFNVFLFAGLCAWMVFRGFHDPGEQVLPYLFLVTPQLWYVFSYFNNDAFAFFAASLMADQLATRESITRRSLGSGGRWHEAVFFGCLAGILLICKTNYWIFIVFAVAWLVLKYGIGRNVLKKFAMMGAIALVIVGCRVSLDLYVNGETNFAGMSYVNYMAGRSGHDGSKLREYQEQIAEPQFKPSTLDNDPAATDYTTRLKAKGVPFSAIFTKWWFHTTSFQSFTGIYGWMDTLAGPWYYLSMAAIYVLSVFYIGWSIIRSNEGRARIALTVTAACSLLTVLLSAYLSWTYAFQAQGRYLFPVLLMTAVLAHAFRRCFDNRVIHALVGAAFVLSFYSFIFIGIAKVNR